MKILAMLVSSAVIIVLLISYVPTLRIKSYEREVDSLAFAYRVYESDVCPNKSKLKAIREDYAKDETNLNKLLWVNKEFDLRFMSTCLESNPHRGDQ